MPRPLRSIARFVLVLALSLTLPLQAAGRARAARHFFTPDMLGIRHVVLVILENTDAAQALQQPFLSKLAADGALLRNYHSLTHPSYPNYIALTAGSAYGITTDNVVTIDVPHIGNLLERAGLSWKVYASNYPGGCYLGNTAAGQYVRKHVPFLSFTNVQNDPARCARIVDATALDADIASGTLPSFSLYVPNDSDNGHDTSVVSADAWLSGRFGPLLNDPRFTSGTLLIVTFDEGQTSGPNIVYTAFYGDAVIPGSVSDTYYDHYNLLRTIEDILGTATLGKHDATAAPITDIWKRR